MGIEMDLDGKIKEAEVYHTMGLPRESLVLYEQVLSSIPAQEQEIQSHVLNKISRIKEEIEEKYPDETAELSSGDVTGIQEALSAVDENAPAINDCAFAFKELGLYKEAITEYEKLFDLDFPFESIIPDICDCLFKLYPTMEIIIQIDKYFKKFKFDDDQMAEIKFNLGLELEKRDNKEQALYYYESALELAPKNEVIKSRLNALAAHFATGSNMIFF